EMVARGNVVVLRVDGTERIETEELYYNPQTHRIWSTVHTTRTVNGCTQEGDGVQTDDQFRSVTLENARGCLPGGIVFCCCFDASFRPSRCCSWPSLPMRRG